MATEMLFRTYCERFNLAVLDQTDLVDLFGEEEWGDDLGDETVVLAGFFDDPGMGAMGALLKRDGKMEVVTAFSDGKTLLEDTWGQVTDRAVELSILAGRALHAGEEG